MKILIIDVETTGLDTQRDQLLEIGAAVLRIPKATEIAHELPFEDVRLTIPIFRAIIYRERVEGHPIAMAMNAGLMREMYRPLTDDEKQAGRPTGVYDVKMATHLLHKFLREHFADQKKITAAGKNIAAFDLNFLAALPGASRDGAELHVRDPEPDGFIKSTKKIVIAARVLDPGTLFFWPDVDDDTLPGLDKCLQRAGIKKTSDHTAVADCLLVAELLWAYYTQPGLQWCPEEWSAKGRKS